MEQNQKAMTEEEIKKSVEESKKEWESLIANFGCYPDKPVTKGELLKVVEFITSEVQMIGEMSSVALHNTQALHQNFQSLVGAITSRTNGIAPIAKTKGGIILP